MARGLAGAFGLLMLLPGSSEGHGPACRDPTVRVDKSEAILVLACRGHEVGRFPVTFGAHPAGPKLREGDERTPEGRYRITSRLRTRRFHRFLGLSYPNAEDRRRARALGVRRPGGGIGIHGVATGHAALATTFIRWAREAGLSRVWGPTDGCIGLANEDVEQVYEAVRVGTPVLIEP
jgi:murein L,D-transpeptidase YafK